MAPLKLRTTRSRRSPADEAATYERPDDLYALFAQAELPTSPADPTPPTDITATEPSEPSVIERRVAWDQAPAAWAPLARRASDADLQRAAVASRLAALVVRRRRLADERTRTSIHIEVLPPPDRTDPPASPTPASAATKPARAAPQPEPLINAIPLPPALAPDSAHLALTSLRVAVRLVPLLLPAPATRIDTRDATRMLGDYSAHALAAWLEAWSRRPVVQFFRASGNHIFDATVLQYLLADPLAVALASDTTLAYDAVRLLHATEAQP
jgi:hypothetical protein